MEGNIDWEKELKNDANFDQKVPYNINKIESALTNACKDLDHLNPYYTLVAVYEFTKFFDKISSSLAKGFSDITSKVGKMRRKFKKYPECKDIQKLITKEIELDIHKLNGNNNEKFGYKKDSEYGTYCSAARTFLRLLWFMEFLIEIFKTILADRKKDTIKKIIGDSYDKILAPRHTWLVRRAVGAAMFFGVSGSKEDAVKIIFCCDKYDDNARQKITKIKDLLEKVWSAGNEFYKKCDILNLE
jgi:hypothetical protein